MDKRRRTEVYACGGHHGRKDGEWTRDTERLGNASDKGAMFKMLDDVRVFLSEHIAKVSAGLEIVEGIEAHSLQVTAGFTQIVDLQTERFRPAEDVPLVGAQSTGVRYRRE